tara:strand:- start:766 stop:2385 length:1620 start_codon:yes stop_codon:yes gene_type:complete
MQLEEQLPRIQNLIREKIGTIPTKTIHNDELMRKSFESLYQALPRMIRIAINESKFVEFCMSNRERLLNINDKASEKYSRRETNLAEQDQDNKSNGSKLKNNSQIKESELLEKASKFFVPTYAPNLILSRGLGAKVWDINDNSYIDFGSGISVNNSGHIDSELLEALTEQSVKLWHTTNLYLTEPSIRLAEELVNTTFADRVFFCNSGAEANEAAIKIARKFSSINNSNKNKREILTFEGSFHGRTLTTISATAQPKYQKGFEPLTEGFRYCPFNDFEKVEKMIGPQTCAVLIEPIQGEGGVNPVESNFLKHLRKLCDQHQTLLIFDEIQCGMGRTGKLFGYQWENHSESEPQKEKSHKENKNMFNFIESDLMPDILTMAKALGGGLPLGAMLCSEKVATSFKPGDHGTTFGGNPIVTAVALASLKKINSPELMLQVQKKGKYIRKKLDLLNDELNMFETIRGRGLMLGAVLSKAWKGKAPKIANLSQEYGVLVLTAGPDILRLLPPLNISYEELDIGLNRIGKALNKLHAVELSSSKH